MNKIVGIGIAIIGIIGIISISAVISMNSSNDNDSVSQEVSFDDTIEVEVSEDIIQEKVSEDSGNNISIELTESIGLSTP